MILKRCVEEFNVPPKHRLSLLTRIQYACALGSARMCILFSRICILAFIVLVQSNDAYAEVASLFRNDPEYSNELIRLVRSEKFIPAAIRTLSMLAINAQFAACAQLPGRSTLFSLFGFAGRNYMFLLQESITSLSDSSGSLFIDALLQFFLIHMLCCSDSSSDLRVSGLVLPLLQLLRKSNRAHMHLDYLAVMTLQKLMDYSRTALSIFKDNDGVVLLSGKLWNEVDKIIDDSIIYDDDYLYSQKQLIKMLLRALDSATYSQENPTTSQNVNYISLLSPLSLIIQNVNRFGGDIYFSAVAVMCKIVDKNLTSFVVLEEAGLPQAFLSSVVSGIKSYRLRMTITSSRRRLKTLKDADLQHNDEGHA